ncbi:39S ribosomal protein L12, mitochondrial [Chrysoperla carnea]|uniref:39S ribosomal protein L12, mitochondrial n=1 Tax=Chrysoperla carnea TaxID=189513 RepID=UPI001D07024F|nr:39S ribosomal protein L12, mitochondrial [Chrysoperla carnea]
MQNIRTPMSQCFKLYRHFSKSTISRTAVTAQVTPNEPLTVPPPSNVEKTFPPKIENIVNAISQLNLLEVSELSEALKKRLNLPDAPILPAGGFAVGGAVAAPVEEEEVAPKVVKTAFTVKLTKFDEKQKVALIKEIKNLLEGMNLVQAKKFVESAPTVVKADIAKDEAEKLKEALTKVGAVVEIE